MTTAFEKFRKLLAAYEDEVQRKQTKLGNRVDPNDEVQPNWNSGYCTFLRGQTVVWSPSFELIGTFAPMTGAWVWGWADINVDVRLRNRVGAVRSEGAQWGIDIMTSEALQIADEQQAWELATVATAVSRADGMVRVMDGDHQRYLAVFDGPPATRSSTSMRAIRESQMGMAAVVAPSTPAPALQPALTPSSPPRSIRASPTSIPPPPPSVAIIGAPMSDEREPSAATRSELAQRLYEAVPYVQQQQIGVVKMIARAIPPAGPVGAVAMDVRLTMTPVAGGAEVPVAPTAALHDALVALWLRCRDRMGTPYRFATARLESSRAGQPLEPGPRGFVANVFLEW